MAEAVTIARPYAEAAFKIGRDTGTLPQWSESLELIQTVSRDEDVARRISDPNFSRAQLEALLLGICGGRLDGAARNFVQLLVQNSRLEVIAEIRALFEQLKLEHED